ncbi:MAG TPA: sugar ABC transporter substrate-binding protein [Bacillota bacterium]|nr:sugar ABC transporter substrate-binding protein [Bacillota bacterium]
MKKLLSIALAVVMLLSLVACGGGGEEATEEGLYEGAPAGLAERDTPVKVAVIRNLGADEHTAQFLAGTIEEGTSLGFIVDTFTTNGDNAKFEDTFNQVLIGGYDGIIVSHGQDNAPPLIQQAVDEGIAVVTFDTNVEIEGVTVTAQDDMSLAELSLSALVDAYPDKTPKIIKMWVAGFPPMERREVVYQEYLKAGMNANAIGSLMAQYPVGEIDAIWACWDAFATGAFTALKENNRTEIKIFGIDVSNADLQMMQEEDSPWVMTAAADAKLVGTVNMRLLAKKLAGEDTPDSVEIPATTIYQEDLLAAGGSVTVETLSDVYDTWGKSDMFNEDWMKALREKNAK